ncbi:MAG: nitronate monooxygenase [Hyphomicrobiaceae bacterium]|nr:nitronate monooxygenase [Hyphomicrobiaceae bacterium]
MTQSALERFGSRLSLPLIAAPMFLVSGVDLVVAACCAGVVGAFPTANCRSAEELDQWLAEIRRRIEVHEQRAGRAAAPYCVNLIVHKSNTRLPEDLAVLRRHAPELVITSVGSPAAVLPPLHEAGALVLADVASLKHAEKALAVGVDGLILLSAGAGGQTGWLNPFAFVRAVRTMYDGPLVLAGGVSDGAALFAAECLGCDLAYMGTKLIATHESMASDGYKRMLVASSADDIVLTRAFTGLETNMLRPSIVAAGLDPDALPARGAIDIAKDISIEGREARPKRWRDIWTAGHSVSGIRDVASVADLVAETAAEYAAARRRVARGLGPA